MRPHQKKGPVGDMRRLAEHMARLTALCATAAQSDLAALPSSTGSMPCGNRVNVRLAARPHLCRQLAAASCDFFYIKWDSAPRPCLRATSGDHRCVAGPHEACTGEQKISPKRTVMGEQARLAYRRQRKLRRRSVAAHLEQPCTSTLAGDSNTADCEDWCSTNGTLTACKYCKCRACRICYTTGLPAWATATLKGVRAACDLFGTAICNATGNISATIRKVEDDAYARWEFNHTNMWIDALFATRYRAEGAVYAALAPSLPRLVAAEEGLAAAEVRALRSDG